MDSDILEKLDYLRHIKNVGDEKLSIAGQAAMEIRRLGLLLIRKNEALAIVADPAMWSKVRYGDDPWFLKWNGTGEFADPMAWAKREAEAEEPTS